MPFKICVLLIVLFCSLKVYSNQNSEFCGWGAVFHSQRLNEKLGLHLDVQARSADEFDYLKNILVRPGVTYFINKEMNVTLGYAWVNSKFKSDLLDVNLTEQRIWEQLIYLQKIGDVGLNHRLRFEQRFIEQVQGNVFSQRLRYFVRTLLPFSNQTPFTEGIFLGLQNELFFNVQNKVNGSFFDQNRAYVSLGYRFKPSFDLEMGYMNQRIKQRTEGLTNNILQLAAYTRF
ncbi:Protein of unknown function DUF2490 [Pseudopedobacter saltans DSM 12145]|uniref:DUF2490 domain-containing protein n=1 Tax=Pseudopedobacter saltans (strain ATCC 51119 / DSM 12145 / JCM 21818 / CCUG 39354 / LMG 10337 / NBRC 100064 / NCIMB 13643) TaxID=762903 RepID=F0S4R6_PSESL|nr:DUF2490 domain-containing protein [Pseudopedobacter saltans]ADY53084.1 Protein of unknown function DUF2490 [Pseudopedobacter saltans DSM 12145]